ncbi:hypothetical protein CKM354_000492300 [Cercospora kikuchii]|uniref:Heterokaryon incompatibility domain-containing protein n=1 Tax=Cercospora kikuchii TaxID=84275 RepID=A0A9P3FG92_9PEZI|nr:uncharacterized protein CKM354_000492300 [Cercospora kikuchii]GIZ41624.1 hypothetical protein CKM354_000492300 [Cercospora kikuchii]
MESDIQIYTPLDVAAGQIRIARILPSDDCAAVVQCELDIVALPALETTFEALSYCWGDPTITADIELNGVVAAVTVNLEAALRQFRADAEGKAVVIWIDAICINQQDVDERNSQVTLMQGVYTKATNVRIWLGVADEMSEKLCRILRRLINEPTSSNSLESLSVEEHSIEVRMIYLSVLFAYGYWARRWIVQEVRCAQHRTLHIGQYIEELPLDVFAKLREYIRVQVILALYQAFCVKKNPSIEMGHDGLPESSSIGEAALVLGHMLEHSHTVLADLNNKQQWHNFLRALKTSECSVEHDTIYAFLGLLPNKLGMEVDYKVPIVDLLCEFTWRWIQHHQTLNCFYDVRNVDPDLPSWIPELRYSKLKISTLGTRALGPEAISPDTLSAGEFKAHAGATKSQLTRIDHYTVSVGTFLFDTIVAVSPNEGPSTNNDLKGLTVQDAVQQKLPSDWLDLYEKHCTTTYPAHTAHDIILRTFNMNQDRHLGPREDASSDKPWVGGSKKFAALFRLLNKTSSGGPFFTFYVTEKGRCGVCIPEIQVGDRIGIVARLWMPFVFRKVERRGRAGNLLVSSCYLHGVMDGEAVLDAVGGDESKVNDVFEQLVIV